MSTTAVIERLEQLGAQNVRERLPYQIKGEPVPPPVLDFDMRGCECTLRDLTVLAADALVARARAKLDGAALAELRRQDHEREKAARAVRVREARERGLAARRARLGGEG
jgi:hypothetical protein